MTTFVTKKCPVCKGKGEVPNGHKYGLPCDGVVTGYAYPVRTGGCSGEIVADPKRSYCAECHGTGMKTKKV